MEDHLDPSIREKLRKFASHRRKLVLLRGVCSILVVLLGGLLLISLLDYSIFLSDTVRIAMTTTVYGAAGLTLIRMLVIPFWRLPDRKKLAYMLESLQPDLRENLISAVELGEQDRTIDSLAFVQKLQEEVGQQVESIDIPRLLPLTYIRSWLFGAGGLTLLLAVLCFVPNLQFRTLMIRAVYPGANVGRVSDVSVHIRSPNPVEPLVPYGDRVPLLVDVEGANPESITLQTVEPGQDEQDTAVSRSENGTYDTTIRVGRKPMRYRIQASTALTRYYEITTTSRPRVKQFTRVYHPPEYTNINRRKEVGEKGTLHGLRGGSVDLSLKTSEPVASGYLKVDYEDGNRTEKIELKRVSDTVLSTTLPLETSGTYRVHLVSKRTGFDNRFSPMYEIHPQPDRLPTVELDEPNPHETGVLSRGLTWKETFDDLENGTVKDTGQTAWDVVRNTPEDGMDLSVKNGRLLATTTGDSNGNTDVAGIWTTEKVSIDGMGPVRVAMDVSGRESSGGNGLEDGGKKKDTFRMFYRVDGGAYRRVADVSGEPENQRIESPAITGRTLQLKVEAKTTEDSEYYAWDNVSVTPEMAGDLSEKSGDTNQSERLTFVRSVNDVVHLTGRAKDDVGLKSVDRWVRVNGGNWQKKQLIDGAGRRYEIDHLLNLYSLGVENGDRLDVKVTAKDLRGSVVESKTLNFRIRTLSSDSPHLKRISRLRQFQNAFTRWGRSVRHLREQVKNATNKSSSLSPLKKQLSKSNNHFDELKNAARQFLMEENSVLLDSVVVELTRRAGFARNTQFRPLQRALSGSGDTTDSVSADQLLNMHELLQKTAETTAGAVQAGRRMFVSDVTGVAMTELRRAIRRHRRLVNGWKELREEQGNSGGPAYVRPLTETARHLQTIEELFGDLQRNLPETARQPMSDLYRTLADQRKTLVEKLKKENPDQQALLQLTKSNQRVLSKGLRLLRNNRRTIQKQDRRALKSVYRSPHETRKVIRGLRTVLRDGNKETTSTSLKAQRTVVKKQLEFRANLEEWRSSASLQFSSDVDLAARAIDGVFRAREKRDDRASAIADVETAVNVLETGHRALEIRLGANQFSGAFESQFSSVPHELLYQSRLWHWWKNRVQSVIPQVKRIDTWKEPSESLSELLRGNAAQRMDRVMKKRRRLLSSVGTSVKQMGSFRSRLTSTVEKLQPRMNEARETLRKYVPELHEVMQDLANRVQNQKKSTEKAASGGDDSDPSMQEISDQQRSLNERIQDLQNRLRRDANAQDLTQNEGLEQARDADDARAMLRNASSNVNENMRRALTSQEPTQQQKRLRKAAQAQEELQKQLAQLSEHFENRSKNQNVSQTRKELREAEKQLGIRDELDSSYDRAETLSGLSDADREQLEQQTQNVLRESPELRDSLVRRSKQMVSLAKRALEKAAEQQDDISTALKNLTRPQNERSDQRGQAVASAQGEQQDRTSTDPSSGHQQDSVTSKSETSLNDGQQQSGDVSSPARTSGSSSPETAGERTAEGGQGKTAQTAQSSDGSRQSELRGQPIASSDDGGQKQQKSASTNQQEGDGTPEKNSSSGPPELADAEGQTQTSAPSSSGSDQTGAQEQTAGQASGAVQETGSDTTNSGQKEGNEPSSSSNKSAQAAADTPGDTSGEDTGSPETTTDRPSESSGSGSEPSGSSEALSGQSSPSEPSQQENGDQQTARSETSGQQNGQGPASGDGKNGAGEQDGSESGGNQQVASNASGGERKDGGQQASSDSSNPSGADSSTSGQAASSGQADGEDPSSPSSAVPQQARASGQQGSQASPSEQDSTASAGSGEPGQQETAASGTEAGASDSGSGQQSGTEPSGQAGAQGAQTQGSPSSGASGQPGGQAQSGAQTNASGQQADGLSGKQGAVSESVQQASEMIQGAAKQQSALGNDQRAEQLTQAGQATGDIASEQIPKAQKALQQNPQAAEEPVRQVAASLREQVEQLSETNPSTGTEQSGAEIGRSESASLPGGEPLAQALSNALSGTTSPQQAAEQAASAQASRMQHRRLRNDATATGSRASAGTSMAGTPSSSGESGSSSSESSGQDASSSSQTASSGKGETWTAKGSTATGGTGATGAPAIASPPPTGELPKLQDLKPGDWGGLPEKLAEDAMKGQNESVSGEYQESVRAYFRAIAELSKKQK